MGIDYGFLFQDGDLCHRKSDAINYEYYDQHPEEKDELLEAEELFVRPLSRILPRLNILGFTLESARAEYQAVVEARVDLDSYIDTQENKYEYLTFEEFCDLACCYQLSTLNNTYIEYSTPDRDTLSQGRLAADIELFNRIPGTLDSDNYWSESSFMADQMCILSAESMLQIFGLNHANLDVEVTWEFGPLVSAGWAQRDYFVAGARLKQKILIATEGASDARIIQRSLNLFRPDVADFFNFVDNVERHHFWGTGNLVKFAEGLLRINILNKVLFIFDNDAEGIDALQKIEKLKLPANMRAIHLPDHEEFKKFVTYGPDGENISDINGRAAAIECYLDLHLDQYPSAKVIWSNFKKDIGVWHGVLDFKESYSKHFYEQKDDELKNGSYDISKLSILLDSLILEAGRITPVI